MTYGQLVDVDFDEVNVGELGGHAVEDRLHHLARTAPRRREIDHQLRSPISTKENKTKIRESKISDL